MLIGIDIDEVLSETLDFALDFHNHKIGGKRMERNQISSYFLPDNPGFEHVSKEEAIRYFTEAMLYAAEHGWLKPVKWAKEALENGKAHGHTFVAITARGNIVKEATHQWIEEFFPGVFDDVIFCNYHNPDEEQFSKEEICHKLGVKMMVDDNLNYARDLAKAGIPVYLLEKPWNMTYNSDIDFNIQKVATRMDIDFDQLPVARH